MNIKRLVAREGLIIIACLLLFLIPLIIPNSIVLINKERPIDLLEETRLQVREKQTGMIYTIIAKKKDLQEKSPTYDITREEAIKELERRGKLQYKDINKLDIVRKELPLDGLKDRLFVIALLLYPIYLLIRFILWAIKTLKLGA